MSKNKKNSTEEIWLLNEENVSEAVITNDWLLHSGRSQMDISYSIINGNKHGIRVGSALMGYYIVPGGQQYDHEDTILVIRVKISPSQSFRLADPLLSSTHIDQIIKKAIDVKIKTEWGCDLSIERKLEFGIKLNKVIPDTGTTGYYSEFLGVYIDIGCVKEITFKNNIPDALKFIFEGKQDIVTLEDSFCYSLTTYIDNSRKQGPIWTMRNGKPVKINSSMKNGLPSGLYIFNNETQRNPGKNYTFIEIEKFHDEGVLASEGYALSEKELIDGLQTKAGVKLKKEKDELEKKIVEVEDKMTEFMDKLGRLSREKDRLKDELADAKREATLAKSDAERIINETKSECNRLLKISKERHEREKEDYNRTLKNLREKHEHTVSDLERTYKHTVYELKEEISTENRIAKKQDRSLKNICGWLGIATGVSKLFFDLTGMRKPTRR